MYIMGQSMPLIIYAARYGFSQGDYLIGHSWRRQPNQYLEEIALFAGRRVWVVFSHNCYWCPVDEQAYIVSHLDALGKRLAEIHAPKTGAYLYDFR